MDAMIIDWETSAGIVKEIINGYLKTQKISKSNSYTQFDVKILKDRQFCSAQVMSTQKNGQDIQFVLNTALMTHIPDQTFSTHRIVVAKLFKKTIQYKRKVEVFDVIWIRSSSVLLESQPEIKEFADFSHLKEYMAVKLEFKCTSSFYKEFTNLVTSNMRTLECNNPNIKFSVRVNNKYVYKNRVHLDEGARCCKILASAMNSVIRQSLNEEFRNDCVRKLRIKRSVEVSIFCHLISMLNKNYVNPFDYYQSSSDKSKMSCNNTAIVLQDSKMAYITTKVKTKHNRRDEDSEEDIFTS